MNTNDNRTIFEAYYGDEVHNTTSRSEPGGANIDAKIEEVIVENLESFKSLKDELNTSTQVVMDGLRTKDKVIFKLIKSKLLEKLS